MAIALLIRLREANGAFVTPTALGDDLDGVRKDLDKLEAMGHVLERHPYLGVAYRGFPERLCPDQIEHDLGTKRVGRRIAVWNRVASTNDLAAHAAGSSANDGLVVLAEEQSAGRGRRGRHWSAPPRSSLLMSVLLHPPPALGSTPWLTALGAVAVAEVVARATGLNARIKWPNDVRVEGRKVAGILVERGAGAVIGIGLNVNIPAGDFPEDLAQSATSLQILQGEALDRSEIARALIQELDRWYEFGLAEGSGSLSGVWRARSEHLGRAVEIKTRAGLFAGALDDIDLENGLSLIDPGGQIHRFDAREILELRQTGNPAAE